MSAFLFFKNLFYVILLPVFFFFSSFSLSKSFFFLFLLRSFSSSFFSSLIFHLYLLFFFSFFVLFLLSFLSFCLFFSSLISHLFLFFPPFSSISLSSLRNVLFRYRFLTINPFAGLFHIIEANLNFITFLWLLLFDKFPNNNQNKEFVSLK